MLLIRACRGDADQCSFQRCTSVVLKAWRAAEILCGRTAFASSGGSRCGSLLSPSDAALASRSAASLPSTSSCPDTQVIFNFTCLLLRGLEIQLAISCIRLRIRCPGRERMCSIDWMMPWLSRRIVAVFIPLSLCRSSSASTTPIPSAS